MMEKRSSNRRNKFNFSADMEYMLSVVSAVAEPLISVVYVSSAVSLMSEEELISILQVSRRNNAREGITGMLLYRDGNFMQVLEGPESKVSERLAIICKDSRHRSFLRLVTIHDQTRSFQEWSMGFRNLSSLEPEELSGYTSFLSTSLLDASYTTEPSKALKLLNLFKRSMR
jgi:hypothetical protein